MHQIRSRQRVTAPCGSFHIQCTVRQRIAVRQVGNHHSRHIQRAQGCQRCQHGGGFRGISDIEDHTVEAVHAQLAAAQRTEAAHQIIHVIVSCRILRVIPAAHLLIREQQQEVFFFSQRIQPQTLHALFCGSRVRAVAQHHNHLCLLGVGASALGRITVHRTICAVGGMDIVFLLQFCIGQSWHGLQDDMPGLRRKLDKWIHRIIHS